MGPGGPLVRFDQSPLPPLLCPSRGGASGDRRRRTAVLRGHPSAGMDPPLLGGPSGGRRVAGGGGSRRRRAPRRRGASVTKWYLGYGGLRPKLIEGLHSREGGGVLGGEIGEGEALVVTESTGAWRRPNWPDLGKKTFPSSNAGQGNSKRITGG